MEYAAVAQRVTQASRLESIRVTDRISNDMACGWERLVSQAAWVTGMVKGLLAGSAQPPWLRQFNIASGTKKGPWAVRRTQVGQVPICPCDAANSSCLRRPMETVKTAHKKSGRQKMEAALMRESDTAIAGRVALHDSFHAVCLIGLSSATAWATAQGRDQRCGGR